MIAGLDRNIQYLPNLQTKLFSRMAANHWANSRSGRRLPEARAEKKLISSFFWSRDGKVNIERPNWKINTQMLTCIKFKGKYTLRKSKLSQWQLPVNIFGLQNVSIFSYFHILHQMADIGNSFSRLEASPVLALHIREVTYIGQSRHTKFSDISFSLWYFQVLKDGTLWGEIWDSLVWTKGERQRGSQFPGASFEY